MVRWKVLNKQYSVLEEKDLIMFDTETHVCQVPDVHA